MKNNEIYLWDINWIEYLNKKDAFYQLLSPQEQHRATRYQFEHHQNQFIMTRAILRILIGHLLDQAPDTIAFEYTSLGKPQLANNNFLYFSVAHSKHKALYAFCRYPDIGVDVEYQKRVPFESIATRYFSDRENQILKSLNTQQKQAAFFKGWVQKEAIAKAVGLGFQLPFNQIEVQLTNDFPGIVALPEQLHHPLYWYCHEIKIDKSFKAVVAVRTPNIVMNCTQFTQINMPVYLKG